MCNVLCRNGFIKISKPTNRHWGIYDLIFQTRIDKFSNAFSQKKSNTLSIFERNYLHCALVSRLLFSIRERCVDWLKIYTRSKIIVDWLSVSWLEFKRSDWSKASVANKSRRWLVESRRTKENPSLIGWPYTEGDLTSKIKTNTFKQANVEPSVFKLKMVRNVWVLVMVKLFLYSS